MPLPFSQETITVIREIPVGSDTFTLTTDGVAVPVCAVAFCVNKERKSVVSVANPIARDRNDVGA